MREKHTVQRSIFEHYAEHEIGRELKAISDWLDQHMDLLDRVATDINPYNVEDTGRKGLSGPFNFSDPTDVAVGAPRANLYT